MPRNPKKKKSKSKRSRAERMSMTGYKPNGYVIVDSSGYPLNSTLYPTKERAKEQAKTLGLSMMLGGALMGGPGSRAAYIVPWDSSTSKMVSVDHAKKHIKSGRATKVNPRRNPQYPFKHLKKITLTAKKTMRGFFTKGKRYSGYYDPREGTITLRDNKGKGSTFPNHKLGKTHAVQIFGFDTTTGRKLMSRKTKKRSRRNPRRFSTPAFFPSIADVRSELKANWDWMRSNLSRRDLYDEWGGGEPGTDVRLQVAPNGAWAIHTGDPSYDQDHRGYWGASILLWERQNLTDLAKDLLDQAAEQHAMGGGEDW